MQLLNTPAARHAAVIAMLWSVAVWAQETKPSPSSPVVAARVNETPIHVHLLEADLRSSLKGRKLTPAAEKVLKAEILERVTKRLLIIQNLQATALGAKAIEVDAAINELRKQLGNQKETLESFLAKSKIRLQDLRTKLAWQICWGRYLKKYVTANNLARYFEQHKPEFDGTQRRVRHILIKGHKTRGRTQLEKLRVQLADGQVSFEEAARKHSQAPTAAKGGDIGWISRRQPMGESFSRAVFKLKKNGISGVVKSPFGYHLVQWTESKPGTKTLKEVEPIVRRAIADYLFDWLSDQQRKQTKISYTKAWPHFEPGTHEIKD